ncbi:MAG: hypothetical protein LBS26_04920 [Campylobacteraceae bacterium]|nr:hypothetical protein [Campylobacteraceae bacterium]
MASIVDFKGLNVLERLDDEILNSQSFKAELEKQGILYSIDSNGKVWIDSNSNAKTDEDELFGNKTKNGFEELKEIADSNYYNNLTLKFSNATNRNNIIRI